MSRKTATAIAVIALAGLYLLVARPRSAPPTAPETSARVVADEYRRNEVAADRHYRGEWFIVTGTVTRVNNSAGSVVVGLGDGGDVDLVACEMAPNQTVQIERLRSGLPAAVIGRCVGVGLSRPRFEDCRVVEH